MLIHLAVSQQILYTEDMVKVKDSIQQNKKIILTGPKRCGKSFFTAVLFITLLK